MLGAQTTVEGSDRPADAAPAGPAVAMIDRSPTVSVVTPRRRVPFLALALVILGLAITGVLSATSLAQYHHTEDRLLHLRVAGAGAVLTEALPAVQTPLASAAALADATHGNPATFRSYMAAYVGTGRQPFISASLWSPDSPDAPLVVVGSRPVLANDRQAAAAFILKTEQIPLLTLIGPLGTTDVRLGYGFSTPGNPNGYIAYAESRLPANHQAGSSPGSGFADLHYALYLGPVARPDRLLEADVAHLPLPGRQVSTVVPFGSGSLTLVMAPTQPLSGTLPQRLPWIILGGGIVLSLAVGLITDRLTRRRRHAEQLAADLNRMAVENARLYAEQRAVAETLQRALLPDIPARVAGAEVAVTYLPGVRGMEIGGDWYDAVEVAEDQLLVIVGDVSGRGLPAARVMASLLYATRAYAAESGRPGDILRKLAGLVSLPEAGHFATVLVAHLDFGRRQWTIANAGHPPALILSDGDATFAAGQVDVPIGVGGPAGYPVTSGPLPPGSTVLLYTDGLIERRGESLDVSFDRLADRARAAYGSSPGALVASLVLDLVGDGSADDTVLMAVRCPS